MLQERWEAIRRMQDIHQRRKAALAYHKDEFERAHSADETTAVATNVQRSEDEIDCTLICDRLC